MRLRPPETVLASVGLAVAASAALAAARLRPRPLHDPPSFQVSDLCQHRQDDLADAAPNRPEPVDIDGHSRIEEPPYGALDVQRVATEPVDGVDVHAVALADLLEQFGEARSVGSEHTPADALVAELLLEVSTEGVTLRVRPTDRWC